MHLRLQCNIWFLACIHIIIGLIVLPTIGLWLKLILLGRSVGAVIVHVLLLIQIFIRTECSQRGHVVGLERLGRTFGRSVGQGVKERVAAQVL